MSNGIRRYEPAEDWFDDASTMEIRAVVGGENYGRGVGFHIGHEHITMTESQVLDLMAVLSKRLACDGDFSATATLDEYTVQEDGSKEVKETTW